MTALEVFTYGETAVRTSLDDDGEVWFVASDVCRVLDHSNPHKAASHIHPRTGEVVLDPPQIRVTVKGLECLHKALGGVAPPPESIPQSTPAEIGAYA